MSRKDIDGYECFVGQTNSQVKTVIRLLSTIIIIFQGPNLMNGDTWLNSIDVIQTLIFILNCKRDELALRGSATFCVVQRVILIMNCKGLD